MKVQMTEWYQDAKIVLKPEQVADVDAQLAGWLLANHKAVAVNDPVTEQGGIHDVEPQFENANVPPQPQKFEKPQRSRRAK